MNELIDRELAEEIVDMDVGDEILLFSDTPWGTEYLAVLEGQFRNLPLVGVVYEIGSGDSECDIFLDLDEIELRPVKSVQTTTYVVA